MDNKPTECVFCVFVCLFLCAAGFADTFTHRSTAEVFNGYLTHKLRDGKKAVFVEGDTGPRYIDPNDYQVQYNHLGRKDRVFIFSVKGPLELICQAAVLEKTLTTAADRGPLFILIEFDTPGGRPDLLQRLCTAISDLRHCQTIAFIKAGRYKGAISSGAALPLACDQVFMAKGTFIGAPLEAALSKRVLKDIGYSLDDEPNGPLRQIWPHLVSIAEQNSRPAPLITAMIEKDAEAVEVIDNGKRLFISAEQLKPTQTLVRIWSGKDTTLTLTAEQAVHCGIADKLVSSKEELFTDLNAAAAKKIRNTAAFRAKREFEQAKLKVDRILLSVDELQQQAAALAKRIGLSNVLISSRPYDRQSEELETVPQQNRMAPDEMSRKLQKALKRLMAKYDQALATAERHPDLQNYTKSVEAAAQSARLLYEETRDRDRQRRMEQNNRRNRRKATIKAEKKNKAY